MKKTAYLFSIFVSSCLVFSGPILADEGERSQRQFSTKSESTTERSLPPILPGETVERGGKKIRVITSAGPVVTGDDIELKDEELQGDVYRDRSRIEIDEVDVIIDSRRDRRRPHSDSNQ